MKTLKKNGVNDDRLGLQEVIENEMIKYCNKVTKTIKWDFCTSSQLRIQCYDSNQNSDFLYINKWVDDLHENKKITMFDSC